MRKIFYLLGQLSDADVDWLLRHGRKRRVAPGTVLIRERQPIDVLYILLEGALEVSGTSLGTNTIRLGSGEVVGEMSFIESRLPSASVTAAEPSSVLEIPRKALAARLESDPAFAARFYRALAMFLSHRLRNTGRQLGYGPDQRLDEDAEADDELDAQMLDSVHLAGARFDHVLQRLLSH
jgi:bacteriocin-type transport-associated protein